MRSESEMLKIIQAVAERDERIRAVILNGSRTDPNVVKDHYQDYDVIYVVNDIQPFKEDINWIDVFGDRIIMQMPNSLDLGPNIDSESDRQLVYLMLFQDHNRIDLTLIEINDVNECGDSFNKVIIDKDHLFDDLTEPSDEDYWIKRPTEKEFIDTCNEFWWVSTYVVKGLGRNEPLYAKGMLDGPVRQMFMKMLAWKVGITTGFNVNVGTYNRFIKNLISIELWDRVLDTYSNAQLLNIWKSFIEMTAIYHDLAIEVAERLGFTYNTSEANNVMKYNQGRFEAVEK